MQEAKQRQLSNCAALIAVCLKRVEKKKGGLMPEWEVRATRPLADDLSRWAAFLSHFVGSPLRWQEIASVGGAVQNMHLVLAAHNSAAAQGEPGLGGYWSSGGCADFEEGWGNWGEARALFGMDGECKGAGPPIP